MSRLFKFRLIDRSGEIRYFTLDQHSAFIPAVRKDDDLSQSTGLIDKNGNEIFENDIVRFYWKGSVVECHVIWDSQKAMFCLKWKDGYINGHHLNAERYEVIGNIFQNPSLF